MYHIKLNDYFSFWIFFAYDFFTQSAESETSKGRFSFTLYLTTTVVSVGLWLQTITETLRLHFMRKDLRTKLLTRGHKSRILYLKLLP